MPGQRSSGKHAASSKRGLLRPALLKKTASAVAAKRKIILAKKSRNGKAAGKNALTLSCLGLYRASPLERIAMIKGGVSAEQTKRLFVNLPIGQGLGFRALNLSVATVNKKAKEGGKLSRDESERIIGFAKLLGQVEAIVQESGDPSDFDAGLWMARWLTEPLPALGGACPADLVDTMEGQGLVSSALAKLQSSAYA